jgi:hypothetical protein
MYSKILYTLILSLLYSEKDVFFIFVLIKILEIIKNNFTHKYTHYIKEDTTSMEEDITSMKNPRRSNRLYLKKIAKQLSSNLLLH